MLMTASLAGSKQMLHSNVARSRSGSLSPPLLLPLGPSPSLLPPAANPPLLAGPPSLEDRGPAAAIIFNVHVQKWMRHSPRRANVSSRISYRSKCDSSASAAHAPSGGNFRFREKQTRTTVQNSALSSINATKCYTVLLFSIFRPPRI